MSSSSRWASMSTPESIWKTVLGVSMVVVAVTVPVAVYFGLRNVEQEDAEIDPRPNFVFVLVDDLGFSDVGYRNSRIRTPNLDRLASEGVRLENYYVQASCTPTRSVLMTGRYQIRTGLQHRVIFPDIPNALPLSSPTLARVLKEAGYSTHMVGKWHLGFYRPEFLPNNRGFDSFYGMLLGAQDYYTHCRLGYLDLYDNLKPDFTKKGQYSTNLYTEKACDVIRAHNPKKGPLFLYLSYQAVHGPMQVPSRYTEEYQDIKNETRRTYAGMVTCLDEGIGNLTAAMKKAGLWNNTVFVFSSDNGGNPKKGGYNYPLRGRKNTLWEGGMRTVGFVVSSLLKNNGSINRGLIHVSDWFPTFLALANISLKNVQPLDGFNQWTTISENAPSARQELLHNIDSLREFIGQPLYNDTFDTRVHAAIRVGDYKLITGDPGDGAWYPPSETNLPAEPSIGQGEGSLGQNAWLFNITQDPEERHDLSSDKPDLVRLLLEQLDYYNSMAVPVVFPNATSDSNPARLGGVWGPWEGVEIHDLGEPGEEYQPPYNCTP